MNRNEVFETVTKICADVFEIDDLELSDATTADDIDEWDSLSHLSVLNEVETTFGFRFTMAEIQSLTNVGCLVDTIMKHV